MIAVSVNKDRFFYDIHSLVKAFYPKETVTCYVAGEKTIDPGKLLLSFDILLREEAGEITVTLKGSDGNARTDGTDCLPMAEGERASSIDLHPVTDERGGRRYNAKNAL
ncbi:MAG: hypothetical protein IK096_02815, partial [Lachnospiraceae bacterium]|nr:hypothetical protein [Lachnospiraceae bacterium]